MHPEDGSTAPQDDVAPQANEENNNDQKPTYETPNDLGFEMSAEEEADYVNQILSSGKYEPKVVDTPVVEKNTEEATPVEPVVPAITEPPKADDVVDDENTELTAPESDDLWVEVETIVIDDDGVETAKTIRLTYDPNDPSSFIPDDFVAKNTKQLAEIMDAKNEMAGLYKEREADFNKASEQEKAATSEKELLASWDQEISDLIESGALTKPALEPTDPKYADDPAVLKQNEVYKFMAQENAKRIDDGRPKIMSFGLAYTMYQNNADRIAAEEKQKQEDAETKRKGALIGGGSASSGGSADPKAYKAGSYNNIWAIPVDD